MNKNVIFAIFRRNLLSYFSNPTGYVFIIIFVVLSSMAAYWPNEFFNTNLANLDQLNRYLPYILLIFVPAITMGIWADERRQGTDELLLTIPATDLDVVLGKYMAAVGVFTLSLAFSAFCNLGMLYMLTKGHPDLRLLIVNYIGYWMVGLAMVATGMVASFFTSNLTVAFILGVVFNAPLVAADWAEAFTGSHDWALEVKHWGLPEQFREFGRGVIGLGPIVYFSMLVVVMLYLCMVLIGRRHWLGGRDGHSLFGHYLARALALIVIAASLNVVAEACNVRYDATAEKSSSLSPETVTLVEGLDMAKRPPIVLEAYVSPSVPENFVQTRLNLLNALHELHALKPESIQVKVVATEPTTPEAAQAEEQFGIKSRKVVDMSRGAAKDEEIFLGVSATCGLEKVVVPFIDIGSPIEYELVRAIATVAQEKRKRLGVVQTDAKLFGGMEFDQMRGPRSRPRQPIIDELEKQYEVVQVDPSKPIEKFDVLMAVQPSSLGPPQLDNLITAIEKGQPTAVFEDPISAFMGVPGTTEEKRGESMMQQMPQPKGDIQKLWRLLGVEMKSTVDRSKTLSFAPQEPSAAVVWQEWNPYFKIAFLSTLPREFVFVGRSEPGSDAPFNDSDSITSGLQELWFPFPGAFRNTNASKMKFVPLVTTGNQTGLIGSDQVRASQFENSELVRAGNQHVTHDQYTLAARITGEHKVTEQVADEKPKDDKNDKSKDGVDKTKKDADADKGKEGDKKKEDGDKGKDAEPEKKTVTKTYPINVVLVADTDLMAANIFELRGEAEEQYGIHLDNVVFIVNALDSLAKDERFVDIRKRRPAHRTLTAIERERDKYQDDMLKTNNEYQDKYNKEKEAIQERGAVAEKREADLEKKINEFREKGEAIPLAVQIELNEAVLAQVAEAQQVKSDLEKLDRDTKRQEDKARREFNSRVREEQNWYKFIAVLIPPIPPFLVAVFVYFRRRAEEREGVAKSRLR